MNFQDRLKNFWLKIKEIIDKGIIQRIARISYDIVWNVILFFLFIGIIGIFLIGGLGAGYFASLVQDEPLRSADSMIDDIYNYEETSEIYFADDVYMGEVRSDLYREEIELDDVSSQAIDAIIATEDEYFETHNGIVPKAILRATFQEFTGSATQTGGSTLTQQIIKNQILTSEVSFDRKAQEIILAMRLEHFMEKDEILEAYLNIVPFGRNANGRNIAGIKAAAEGIFGVEADELNLAQSAFIAGLPQSPIAYTPFTTNGALKDEEGLQPGLNRMQTVLNRMVSADYITEEERDEALEYDLLDSFTTRSPSTYEEYPYLTEEIRGRAEDIMMEQLATEDGYTMEEIEDSEELTEQYQTYASRELSQGGYEIHTTIDKDIYDAFQEVAADYDNYGPDKTATNNNGDAIMTQDPETGEDIPLVTPVQASSVLRDNESGAIIAFVGGRDYDIQNRNFATNANRQLGSTAKPLLVYGPGMEEGAVQPGSIIADVNLDYGYGLGYPTNFVSDRYYGLVSARDALVNSYNVSAMSAYVDILEDNDPVPDYLVPMGFDSIPEQNYRYESNALGSFEATVSENIDGYSTFGNNGQYTEGYMIEKIESPDGEEIYEHESESEDIFSPQTSYLMIDMLRDVLTSGTGTTARNNLSNPGVDWAGKTGTSNEVADSWFIATNPNVTMGTWMGYEYRQQLETGYSGRTQAFWAALVNAATEVDPDLMAPSNSFDQPNNIVTDSYSMVSGMQPSELTESLGLVGSDIFNAEFVPTDEDESLMEGQYVMIDGEAVIAGSDTPEEFTEEDGVIFDPDWLSDMGYDELEDMSQLIPSGNSAWNDVEIPDMDEIEDDGSAPSSPSSVSKSGNVLTWNASSSNDVVGYRIYRADDPDSNFEQYDSTTDTDLNVGSGPAVYEIVAVDYFGRESSPTSPFVDGDFSDDDDNDDDDDQEDSDDNGDSDDQDEEDENDNGDENGNGNGNDNDDGNDNGNDNDNDNDNSNNDDDNSGDDEED
ncbi:penicillin-binding protein [Pelagirhabdus alkalitolerans]|uniref:Penicillin-binding protein n=1 Tax=Pelagirhabdus alkalitolerans TaxID=1612202 RepID=A0A1G6HIZ0_9BACI|nr:transglycosylase domain-containing protein [Pelagirhabdus alkalitolerans]SDB94161.1 penicillin-binding protein [Pelagirhabdus alkalitolerans]